jgi:hypothetical protein
LLLAPRRVSLPLSPTRRDGSGEALIGTTHAVIAPALPAVEQPGPHGREVGEDRKRPAGWGDREPVRVVDHRASVNLSSERSQSAEIDAEQKVNFLRHSV